MLVPLAPRNVGRHHALTRHASTTSGQTTQHNTGGAHPTSAIDRLKRSQGGQNLSDRYRRLERSVRSKQALQQDLDEYNEEGEGGGEHLAHGEEEHSTQAGGGLATQQGAPTQTFKGYVIPDEPRPPEADECCMSGCAVCVYDLYEEALQAYKDSLTSIRAGLVQMGVPESQWPERLREKASKAAKVERPIDISRNAFEEMERSLAAKRAVSNPGSQ
ncbi:hypothetical protein GGF50DRAFT_107991 [Schizophyllum commune]